MHSTYMFMVNYDDCDIPDLTEDQMRKAWITEEAVRLMFSDTSSDSDKITSQNFEKSLLRYMEGLDEKWNSMSEGERKAAEDYEREKAKYAQIAEELESFIEDQYFEEYADGNNWWQSEIAVFKNGMVAPMCSIDDWRGRGWTYYQYLKVKREDRWEQALRDSLKCLAYDFNIPGLNHFHFDEKLTEKETQLNEMTSVQLREYLAYYAPRHMAKNLMEYLAVVINRSRNIEMNDVNIGDLINMIYPPDTTKSGADDTTRTLSIINKEKGEPVWMSDFRLKQALQVYQSFQSAKFIPFTNDLNDPYHNYRCYDLRNWEPSEEGGKNIVNGIWQTSSETKWVNPREDDFIEENTAIVFIDIHT